MTDPYIESEEAYKRGCEAGKEESLTPSEFRRMVIQRGYKKVVCCVECTYWLENNGGEKQTECPWDGEPDEADYCSCGERICYDDK